MIPLVLDYDKAHNFVKKNYYQGFYWEGYTIVKWTPSPEGYLQKNGVYRNGKWGYVIKHKVTNQGTWELNEKYGKYI